ATGGGGATIRVLDLATGGGAIPLALARRAARAGLNITIDGCDKNPQAVEIARIEAAMWGIQTGVFELDVVKRPIPTDYDILTCSLFWTHLDEPEAIAFLSAMRLAARRLVLVDDLVRSRRGYLLAQVGCRVLSGSRIVHADGPVSVAGAFTPGE